MGRAGRRWGIILAFSAALPMVAAWLAGRPATAAQPAPPKFEWIEDSPYLVLSWNCQRPDARTLVVEGVAEVPFRTATNIYYGEVTLVGMNAAGRSVSTNTGFLPPVLYMYQTIPFSVVLGLAGTEVRVDLHYAFDLNTHRGGNSRGPGASIGRPRVIPAARGSFRWFVSGACPLS